MLSTFRLHRTELIFLLAFALVSTMPSIWIRPLPKVRAVYIHPHWHLPTDQTSETTLEHIGHSGINTIFVDVYYPTGPGKGEFLAERKGPWVGGGREPDFQNAFSLEETIERAEKLSISVHVTISCFGELPAIDPTNEVHRAHLRDVIEYILTCFPSVDGIHLDYIRFMHEYGLEAKGNTLPVTTFVQSVRDLVQTKMLSAAVSAADDWDQYEPARYLTGQDYKEMSQYLDFMCPMAYYLSAGKELDWVAGVARFSQSISRKECWIYPVLQAYYQFETRINISREATWPNTAILGPRISLPTATTLVFEITWQNPRNSFSLTVKNPLSQEIPIDRFNRTDTEPNTETFTVSADIAGVWATELKTSSPCQDDTVTVLISDVNEELPGCQALHSAILLAMTQSDGFCVYAFNNLSPEELSAIKDAIELGCRATANNHGASNISELTGHFEQQIPAWQHSVEHVFASQAPASPADSKSQNPALPSFRRVSV